MSVHVHMHILCVWEEVTGQLEKVHSLLKLCGGLRDQAQVVRLVIKCLYPLSHFVCPFLIFWLRPYLHFFHSKPCGPERVASYSWKAICCAVWGLVLFHLLLPSVGHWVRIEGCSNKQLKIWPNKKLWIVLWIEVVNFQVTESMSHSRESVAYRRCPVHHKEDRVDVFRSFHTNLDRNLF